MKKAIVALVVLMLGSTAQAASNKSSSSTLPATRTPEVTPEVYGGSSRRVGAGLATAESLTFNSTAATIWFELNSKTSLQTYLGVGGTKPFQFGVGALVKHSVLEGQAAGIHLGGGIGIGNTVRTATDTASMVSFAAIAGIHTQFPSAPRVQLAIDGGPTLMVGDSQTTFKIGGLSPALGLSAIYIFN